MTIQKSFILYTDQQEIINTLTDEQAGKLLKAIFDYKAGKKVELDTASKIAFITIRLALDRDFKKWENIVERNKKNIRKRYLPKSTKSTSGKTGIPKALDIAIAIAKPKAAKDQDQYQDRPYKEKAWSLYSGSYLSELGVSNPVLVDKCHQEFLEKALHPSAKTVKAFIYAEFSKNSMKKGEIDDIPSL